jgi:hypothetical protein
MSDLTDCRILALARRVYPSVSGRTRIWHSKTTAPVIYTPVVLGSGDVVMTLEEYFFVRRTKEWYLPRWIVRFGYVEEIDTLVVKYAETVKEDK